MSRGFIAKDPSARSRHNLSDYETEREGFSWERARERLAGLPEGRGLNMAFEAVDRHLPEHANRIALRYISPSGRRILTYGELAAQSNRFANVLRELGVGAGDTLFTLAGPSPPLFAAILGALKNRTVASPLFSAFGPEPIASRMIQGKGRVLVTTERLYRRKVAPIRDQLADLEHVLFLEEDAPVETPHGRSMAALMEAASDAFTIRATSPEDMALLHFTSGTTGKPKGAVHVHEAVLVHHVTTRFALDVHPGDVYWCTADPGWVTGTSYGILGPLTCGASMVIVDAPFDPELWYQVLEEEGVEVWYTAPTAVRMCMRSGFDAVRKRDLRQLRFIASVGEPLNPEAVVWGHEAFGKPIHDNWWQTETGGIMIANYAATDIKPGSMGRPVPGIEAAVVRREGERLVVVDDGTEGELALKAGWPSMFRGYLDNEARYRACFADGYYLSGDLAKRDDDGYFWFVGRADDVIKSAGHLIGPFEVESALIEHDAVVEAAVIGKPDEVAGNIIKAFVALKPGVEPTDALRRELMGFARKRLGPAVAPRELDFADTLPKTRSGKIMRRLLKARELGLPEGDTSTLEGGTDE